MKRTGTVNLPLHGGSAPGWLFSRMVKLAEGIGEILIYEHGQEEFLRRISDPCWFQALSCVLGFDWHSSGTTTTTCGALKVAINSKELGVRVAGGKGSTARKTPEEIEEFGNSFFLSSEKIEELAYASRMSAKVDNSCVQDGYQLYHHCLFLTRNGKWAVVQQGMNNDYARRYHWISEGVESFVEEPHAGISCDKIESHVLDMTSKDSEENRKISLDLVKDNPKHLENFFNKNNNKKNFLKEIFVPNKKNSQSEFLCPKNRRAIFGPNLLSANSGPISDNSTAKLSKFRDQRSRTEVADSGQKPIVSDSGQKSISEFTMPVHHPVFDIDVGRDGMKVLQKAYEIQPENYEELVSLRGMGPKKIRALALISELLYGAEPSWKDPVKFSFSHGGKDGFPYPVDRKAYDNSIQVLKDAVEQARIGEKEKLYAIRRLKDFINE